MWFHARGILAWDRSGSSSSIDAGHSVYDTTSVDCRLTSVKICVCGKEKQMRCGAVERVMERGRSATCAGVVLPAGRDVVLPHVLDRKLERRSVMSARGSRSAKTKNSYVCI